MYARPLEAPAGLLVLDGSVAVRELDGSELRDVSGGVIPAAILGGLWILGAMAALVVLGIVVGVAVYTFTHRHY